MDSKKILQAIAHKRGSWTGQGENHEGEAFNAILNLDSRAGGAALIVNFSAHGARGMKPFHVEHGVIAADREHDVAYWVVSANVPTMTRLDLRHFAPDPFEARFGCGDPDDKEVFRMEILLEGGEQTLRYSFFWGMPGQDFGPRSSVEMRRSGSDLAP